MTTVVTADIVGSRRLPARGGRPACAGCGDRSSGVRPASGQEPVTATHGRRWSSRGSIRRSMRPSARCYCCSCSCPTASSAGSASGSGMWQTSPRTAGDIPEGPAWWAAREAIDKVHALQQRTVPTARTWVVAAPEEGATAEREARMANSYLLARDQLVAAMSERTRATDLRPLPRHHAARARELRGDHPVRRVSGARDLGSIGGHRGLPAPAPRERPLRQPGDLPAALTRSRGARARRQTHAHSRLASVPMMNRSRASAEASSENRPMPLIATTPRAPRGTRRRSRRPPEPLEIADRRAAPVTGPRPRPEGHPRRSEPAAIPRTHVPPLSASRTWPCVAMVEHPSGDRAAADDASVTPRSVITSPRIAGTFTGIPRRPREATAPRGSRRRRAGPPTGGRRVTTTSASTPHRVRNRKIDRMPATSASVVRSMPPVCHEPATRLARLPECRASASRARPAGTRRPEASVAPLVA